VTINLTTNEQYFYSAIDKCSDDIQWSSLSRRTTQRQSIYTTLI